ncbi:MAG: hypothetical protein ABSC42_03500 [Tepidisphaeraceae bacterium]
MPIAQAKTFWSGRMWGAIRASPGRSSTVGGLVLILVVAWARLLVMGHTPSAAHGAITSVGPSVPGPIEPPAERRPVQTGPSLQQWVRQPIGPLARNPFAIPFDCYPRDGSKTAAEAAEGNGYWDLLRKSMSSRADQQEQRQILVDNIRIAAEALKLESTIVGPTPGAIVNGQMVREGSNIAGFRVLKIEARQMVVEREGVKLAVTMD